ncbi:hypothetical protein ES703_42500 [subsurface metagenome]
MTNFLAANCYARGGTDNNFKKTDYSLFSFNFFPLCSLRPRRLLTFELLMKLGWHPLVLRSEALLRRVVQTCLGVLENALFEFLE